MQRIPARKTRPSPVPCAGRRASVRATGIGAAGFTLVEVLVALVVMAIMAVMAWQGVDGIVRARDASQARLEQTLRLNTVLAQWEQDLASLQSAGSTVPEVTCDGATVRLSRRTPGGIQVVAWSLRPDDAASAPGSSVWQRWAGPPATTVSALTDSWLRSQQLQGGEPGQIRALDGLLQWQVYFYQGNTWANCQSSLETQQTTNNNGPSPTPTTTVPDGIRLVLSFAPGSGLNGSVTRDTLLMP